MAAAVRAPWIMEKDDFKYPVVVWRRRVRWSALVAIWWWRKKPTNISAVQTVPVMLDKTIENQSSATLVHVEDLVSAILSAIDAPAAHQQLFNICMDEPCGLSGVGRLPERDCSIPSVDIVTPYHSTWLDNTKAKLLLGWRPEYDLKKIIDSAWTYQRAESDPRKIWYPGKVERLESPSPPLAQRRGEGLSLIPKRR